MKIVDSKWLRRPMGERFLRATELMEKPSGKVQKLLALGNALICAMTVVAMGLTLLFHDHVTSTDTATAGGMELRPVILAAAFLRMVDVPVIAAAGLERHGENTDLTGGHRSQETPSDKILGVGGVRFADGEDGPVGGELLGFSGTAHARDDCRALFIRHAVVFCDLEMSLHLRFRFGACRQRRHRQQFAGAPVHVVAGEDVAEEMGFQIFVELRMEIEKTALDGSAAELCLIGGPEINGFPRGKRGRLFPLGNRTI